jgi:hypothetical protein
LACSFSSLWGTNPIVGPYDIFFTSPLSSYTCINQFIHHTV